MRSRNVIFGLVVCLALIIFFTWKGFRKHQTNKLTKVDSVHLQKKKDDLLPVPECGSCDSLKYVNFFGIYDDQKKFKHSPIYISYHDAYIGGYLNVGFSVTITNNRVYVHIYRTGQEAYGEIDFQRNRKISTSDLKLLIEKLKNCNLKSKPYGIPVFVDDELNYQYKGNRLVIKAPGINVMGGDIVSAGVGGEQTDFRKIDSIDRLRSFNISGDFEEAVTIIKSILTKEELQVLKKAQD